jgi:spore germination protein YaaH
VAPARCREIPVTRTVLARVAAASLGAASIGVASAAAPAHAQRIESLWYARGEASVQSFIAHADKISIVSTQSFTIDSTGTIKGAIDPRIVKVAREKGVKLVPLVMNPGFDQPTIHRILTNPTARASALVSLGRMCTDHHLDGIQFDLENIHVSDKDAFTNFSKDAAKVVHAAGCTLSAAVVPRLGEDRGPTSYHQWIWDNWRGAYDYKALAESLDFISYMTYAQHTGNSTAGPVAGFPWTEDCLTYVLSLGVPPQKISLGLAGYSDWWYPSYDEKSSARPRGSDVSYAHAMEVAHRGGATPAWDPVQKALFAQWDVGGVFEAVWIEDARAFAAKQDLVTKYGLRGYSVWKLGDEDPKTWDIVK